MATVRHKMKQEIEYGSAPRVPSHILPERRERILIKTRKTDTVLRLLSIFLLFSLLLAAGCQKGSDQPKTP
jgi:hypothetical protein